MTRERHCKGEPPGNSGVGSLIAEVKNFLEGRAGRMKNWHVTEIMTAEHRENRIKENKRRVENAWDTFTCTS